MQHRVMKLAGQPMRRPGGAAGFSLIELMVVVAIIAILAAVAMPMYTKHVTHTRRVAAEACMSEVANYMERYYTTNMSYKQDPAGTALGIDDIALDCKGPQQTGKFYDYTFSVHTASTYTVKATPKGPQSANDTLCGALTLDQAGTRTAAGTGSPGECWR